MKINRGINAYPYLQVIVLFAGLGSIIGGLIVELSLLLIFREANFAQIGYQPLLYMGLLSFIPALLIGIVIASKQIWHSDKKSVRTTFIVGFIIWALYMASIILFLGLSFSVAEIGLLLISMFIVGLFGGTNSAIASVFALPKACKTSFDNVSKKDHDIYQGVH